MEQLDYPELHDFFLREVLGTHEVPHGNRTLYEHLAGTEKLLRDWGEPSYIRLAGLYHSVYGTVHFRHRSFPIQGRHIIQRLIGPTAEHLVYLFCTLSDRTMTRQLRIIECANLMDQGGASTQLRRILKAGLSGLCLNAVELYVTGGYAGVAGENVCASPTPHPPPQSPPPAQVRHTSER